MAEDVFEIVGTVVGGAFNVEAVVAEGGFAVVYRAYHGAFHAPVALKCLKVPTVSRGSQREFLERFREEGELLFRLSQSIPSVVRPLHIDAFETPKGVFVPYMAQEWLDGETLDVVVARRAAEGRPPMGVKPMVRLLAPVARALARAHNFPGAAGPVSIIHRDLKPDNIMVATINGEEVVKILDFGIAKVKSVATQAAGRMSQDGSNAAVPFTPGYAAPEQWLPKRYGQTGPWTDVWGLALTAVEALAGRAVIDGDHRAMLGTAIDDGRRPSPRSEGVTVSDEVERVFLRALAVDPRDRYRDVGEFWDALEGAAGLARSSGAQTGYTPQPLRDPRSEGPPPALEERLGPAESHRISVIRAPGEAEVSGHKGDSKVSLTAVKQPPAEAAAAPIEFELDLPPAPGAKRADSTSTMKAVREEAEIEAPSVPKAPPGPTILEVSAKESGGAASGLDLAVPADLVRRSSANLRAVNAQALAEPGLSPPSSASGQYRALSAAGKAASGAASPASAPHLSRGLPSRSKSTHKVAMPIVLIVVGLLITVAFYINASTGGGRWAIGPVPINWIAGILVVVGTAMLMVRLLLREE